MIERAREASLPEYEATAIANRAWVAWRCGEEEKAATDAHAALAMWEKLPVRYFYDWMALWPLRAMDMASGRVEEEFHTVQRFHTKHFVSADLAYSIFGPSDGRILELVGDMHIEPSIIVLAIFVLKILH